MSDHGDSEVDPSEEINVDELDSRSCSPRNYINSTENNQNDLPSDCSTSPPPPSHTKALTTETSSPRSHPFSISRLLGDTTTVINQKSPISDDQDSEKERRSSWGWEDINNRHSTIDDEPRSWNGEIEEKLSEKDDDDDDNTTGSTPEIGQNIINNNPQMHTSDLLSSFRMFPGASGLIYTGGASVIRVPAHRPQNSNLQNGGNIQTQGLLPPWSLQALQHSQQQAAAASLHRAGILANLAGHQLQTHPHLKDRLAGKIKN